MKKNLLIIPIVILIIVLIVMNNRASRRKVSQFGKYQRYSEAAYNGYVRSSHYLTLKDGTRLAYDLYLPAKDKVPADEPLPVLFKYTPYLRTFTIYDAEGNFDTPVIDPPPTINLLRNASYQSCVEFPEIEKE